MLPLKIYAIDMYFSRSFICIISNLKAYGSGLS